MKMGVLRVNAIEKPHYRTKINIRPPWLCDMGFVYGALVSAVPQMDGFNLTLQPEDGGKLLRVGQANKKPNPVCHIIINFARDFPLPGLSAGDFLAAGYDYGIIKARKLPEAQNYFVVGAQNYDAFLRMNGSWLSDAGFVPDDIVAVSVSLGCITFRVWKDTTAKYSEIVKFAREHKYQLLQVRKNQHISIIDISGYLLHNAGFVKDDIAGVHYEQGVIKLFKPDLQKLGF
jgi:hypothetical protein